MRKRRCKVCGEIRKAGCREYYRDVHFGYCKKCGRCLGRYLYDPVVNYRVAVPPHSDASRIYHDSIIWEDYWCPHCGKVKERLLAPKSEG